MAEFVDVVRCGDDHARKSFGRGGHFSRCIAAAAGGGQARRWRGGWLSELACPRLGGAALPHDPVYLDHNATTAVHPEVRDAMLPWLGALWGNASSGHVYGQRAAAALAQARARVAALVGAAPDEVIFTSGGTEADNLAILGVELACPRIAMSSVEHPAVEAAVRHRASNPDDIAILPVDAQGSVDLVRASAILREPVGLLSVMLAQNETGVIQPVAELTAMARSASPRVLVHCDAAQAVGKIDVDVRRLGVDLLTIVGHKFYAPAGIGALIVGSGVVVHARSLGGGQERGLRSPKN